MKKIVFIDRDGTIISEPKDQQIDSLEKLEYIPGIISGLKLLVNAGFSLVMVSNQDGLGTKRYPRKGFTLVQNKILRLLEGEGIHFEKIFICPHLREQACNCRKPKTGLLTEYLKSTSIDRKHSFVFGDRETDVDLAINLGVQSVRLTKNRSSKATYTTISAFDACKFIAKSIRSVSFERITNETKISGQLSLDGEGEYKIATGIGFFDHMLSQLARHSLIDLTLKAEGDLHIDEHHTVEDTGIVFGEAIREALGNKRGITRFAAPLDEALAQVVLDLSGRSHLSFSCQFRRERVGEFPTELVEDFFRAFTDGMKATLHITCKGRNDHHNIEAIFKAVGRALKTAIAIDPRIQSILPSTKGVL